MYWLAYGEYRGRRNIRPFLRYVIARLDEENREMAYRIYVTQSLQNVPQNKYITKSYYDMIYPKPEDNRSAEEIADDIIEKAGLIMR